jgi:hypothetical protein
MTAMSVDVNTVDPCGDVDDASFKDEWDGQNDTVVHKVIDIG